MIEEGSKTPTIIFTVLAGIVGLGCLFGGLFFFLGFGFSFTRPAPPVPVTLPPAAVAPSPSVTVALQPDGGVLVDSAPVAPAELAAVLTDRFAAEGDVRVVIAADKSITHARVVEVMDAVKAAGFTKLALAVDSPPK